jgi:hypothetical protein
VRIQDVDKLVEYVEHSMHCEVVESGCEDCGALCKAAYDVILAAREAEIQSQAVLVERRLGGELPKDKPFPCVGESCLTKTIMRCGICGQPCCQVCKGNAAAHPHRVRFKLDAQEFHPVQRYGHWHNDKDVSTKKGNPKGLWVPNMVEIEVDEWAHSVTGLGISQKTGRKVKQMQQQGYKHQQTGEVVKAHYRTIGKKRNVVSRRPVYQGQEFDVSSDDFNGTYHDLLS